MVFNIEKIYDSDAIDAGRNFHVRVFPKINNNFQNLQNGILTTFLPLSGGTMSGNLYVPTLSASTYYSGGTLLETIISSLAAGGVATYVQDGLNTYTGGTPSLPRVNVSGLSIDNIFVSGNTRFNSISGDTISGNTFYSAGTPLDELIYNWDGIDTIFVGEDVLVGNLLFLSGDGRYYKASNTLESTSSTELRLSSENILSGLSGNGLIQGVFNTTGLTQGSKYWVGASGSITSLLPNSDGLIVRYVGTALSSTELEFNPDQTYIELGGGGSPSSDGLSVRKITTSQTALTTDSTIICLSALTLTIPTAIGVSSKKYNIKSRTYETVTINTTGGQLIDDETIVYLTIKNTNITIQSDGENWIIL